VHSSPFANQNCSQFGKIGRSPRPPTLHSLKFLPLTMRGYRDRLVSPARLFCCVSSVVVVARSLARSVFLSFFLFFFLRRRQNCRVERMSWRERERASERAISGTLSQNPAAKLQEFVQYYNQSSCTHW